VVVQGSLASEHSADLALKHGLSSATFTRAFAESGGLLSYGANEPDLFRRSARFVKKILDGGKLSDMPIEQPIKFELVVNLKTAKALGLTVPQSFLARADEVIE
jgi:putative ABC transport system substrate-binding protein